MKTMKLFSMMLCCLAAVSFSSCNSDNDVKTITPEEVGVALNTIKGSYSGKMIYPDAKPSSTTDVTDTLDVTWEVKADTTVAITAIPAPIVASYITDVAVSEAIRGQPEQILKGYIGIYNASPVAFLLNPVSLTYEVTYGGAAHKVQVAFFVNSTYSYGAYNATKKQLTMQMIMAGVYVDGKLQSSMLKSRVPLVFVATR